MAFQVSPGVNISEIDASTSVPALATNTGGLVGRFSKGPIDEIVTVSSVEELRHHFGDPAEDNYRSWFTAANFLSYSNSLKVVRVANDDDSNDTNRIKNAISGIAAATVATARTDNFTGQSSTTDTVFGSSAQSFSYAVNTTAPTASVDLHTTADSAGNYLLPRQSTSGLVTSSQTLGHITSIQRMGLQLVRRQQILVLVFIIQHMTEFLMQKSLTPVHIMVMESL